MRRKKLIFKSKYARDIMLRRKVATIRLLSNVNVGDVVDVIAGHLKVGTAVIEGVAVKKLRDLNDVDALMDGYRSRDDLLRDLRRIYGNRIRDDTEVKIIYFRLL